MSVFYCSFQEATKFRREKRRLARSQHRKRFGGKFVLWGHFISV